MVPTENVYCGPVPHWFYLLLYIVFVVFYGPAYFTALMITPPEHLPLGRQCQGVVRARRHLHQVVFRPLFEKRIANRDWHFVRWRYVATRRILHKSETV